MVTRRGVLSLVTGASLALAGCDGPRETTEQRFGLTTTGAEGVPGQAVAVELTARGVGVVTYRVDALPPTWQVTQGDFDPGPTSVREMYPPELLWEPPIGTVTGSFIIEIPQQAAAGDYALPIEARAGNSDEMVVSTPIITVEGPTSPAPEGTDRSPTPRGSDNSTPRQATGSPSARQATDGPTSPQESG